MYVTSNELHRSLKSFSEINEQTCIFAVAAVVISMLNVGHQLRMQISTRNLVSCSINAVFFFFNRLSFTN